MFLILQPSMDNRECYYVNKFETREQVEEFIKSYHGYCGDLKIYEAKECSIGIIIE